MINLAILVRLEAKPGKKQIVADFIKGALPLAMEEAGTINWFALQMRPSTFGIFDTFETSEARAAHLGDEIAKALMANTPDLPCLR